MNTEKRIREIRKGTLKWYPFREGASVLFVGSEADPLFEMLEEMDVKLSQIDAVKVTSSKHLEKRNTGVYDYIVAIESLEVLQDISDAIICLSKHLYQDGHMILGFNNRLGVRYFFGDRDPYTGQILDGIEDYKRAYGKKEDKFLGRCYDKATIVTMLEDIGMNHSNFSVFPDFSNVQMMLRDDYESKEDFSARVFPTYNYSQTVFMEEDKIYNSLQDNNILHSMANCLLFDCTFSEEMLNLLQVTSSMGRDEEDAFFTIIRDDRSNGKFVEKVPGYEQGKDRLKIMTDIASDLRAHGIDVIDMTLDSNGRLSMPYISKPTVHLYLRQLAFKNKKLFLDKLDEYISVITRSSDHLEEDKGDGEGIIASKVYLDMIPLNCFYIDGRFVFYDQEFCKNNYPVNVVIYRTILTVSWFICEAKLSVSFDDLLKRYNLYEKRDKWAKLEWEFISNLRKDDELNIYYTKIRYDANQVYSNRLRMNFSSEEYLRRFVNIFKGIDNKKVIIFGTGQFAKRFMELYGGDYDVEAVIDNNISCHGEDFYGVKISGADVLDSYEHGTYRVIICIKNFLSVTNQLEKMGISDYVIYDPSQVYERQRKPISVPLNGHSDNSSNNTPKKYHTGYIAGVFDLFHVGHLEKFKLAKEQCDYLIVGLVSDEGVIKHKKTTPFVPFEERKAMLEACRYVDEVVKIPLDFAGTKDAWKMYGFDVQFSGSDYVDNPWWLSEKEFLEQHGVDMVFFPYTESTSSSKLKKLIDEKLI